MLSKMVILKVLPLFLHPDILYVCMCVGGAGEGAVMRGQGGQMCLMRGQGGQMCYQNLTCDGRQF